MPIARTSSLLIAALTAALCAPGHAAEPAPRFERPLTLVQLTDLALSNNPATRIAWAGIRSSEAGVELARAGYWPQIDVGYSYTRLKQVNTNGIAGGVQNRYGPSIDLSYLLWDFGVRSGTADAAKYTLTASQLDANQTMQDLILAVEQDYYQVLGLQAVQDADVQSVQDASANLDAAGRRKDSGLATIGDVYQAEAALAGAKLALQTAQGQLAVARGQLAVALGYPADTPVPLAPWDSQLDAALPPDNIHDLLQMAAGARPEVLASKAQQQAALAALEATKAQGWPVLSLDASAGRTTTYIGGRKNTTNNYSAGLNLSFPLFTGFADQADTRRAQAAADVAAASTDQLVQAVQLEVWQAYQNMHTAASTLETSDAQLKSAQQAGDVTQARYKNGLGSILDVLSAQATLANARVQDIQARLNWFAALAAMGHAMGGLDIPKDKLEPAP